MVYELQFNKPLVPTLKEPIPTKELISRLQSLADELSGVDQENVNIGPLNVIKDQLVNPKVLKHQNPGVQAFACCAIADLLRIFAPDAPFTSVDLTTIFKVFFNQFKRLNDSSNPYFQQQCHLLKRLAEVRSIILITDLKDSEELIQSIFDVFYDLSTKDFPTRLEPLISDILSEIMAEAEIVPHNVLKLILDRFLSQSGQDSALKFGSNITNPGFNFSINICEANADRMSRQVAQYFSELLYESSSLMGNNNDRSNHFKAVDNVKKIHKLSIQIWNYVPGLLNSVIGLIDDELNADDELIRSLATETIGQMISSSISPYNFIITHKETWFTWLKKTLDGASSVRSKWVEQVPLIINSSKANSDVTAELCNGLNKCLLDTDERVRLVSCKSIEQIPFDKYTRICDLNMMNTLFQLIRERSTDIRNQTIKLLSNHYNEYLNFCIENSVLDFGNKNDQESSQLEADLKKIPNKILSLIYINDKNITSNVDLTLFEKLLPFENNTIKRVNRLCDLYNGLDDKGKKSFIAINNRQQQMSKVLTNYLELAESYGKIGSLDDEKENQQDDNNKQNSYEEKQKLINKIEKVIKWFADSTPDGLNTFSCFERFYKLKNFRFFYLIKLCISPESDYMTVKNSMKELLTKLTNSKNIRLEEERSNASTTDMVSNFKLLLYRSSLILYNKSNITELINYSKDIDHEWHDCANELLDHISSNIPDVFKYNIDDFVNSVVEKDPNVSPKTTLKTIYHFVKKFPNLYPSQQEFSDALKELCLTGSVLEAKYAVKVLQWSPLKEMYCSDIMESIYPLNKSNDNFSTHLSTIAELFKVDPMSVESKGSEITTLLIKEVLLVNDFSIEDSDDVQYFINDLELNSNPEKYSKLQEKLLALRIFTNRLISLDENLIDREEVQEIVQPVFKLLVILIGNGGEIVKNSVTPKTFQLKLRLQSGLFLLKIAKCSNYNEYFSESVINKLIYLVQDQNDSIRLEFLTKLQKYLANNNISEKFVPILFFINNEPKPEILRNATTWIKSMYNKLESKSDIKFERSLVRLIHLISLNPEFYESIETDAVKSYNYGINILLFYLNSICKAENTSLLYYLSSRIKQHRNATIDQSLYDVLPFTQEVNNIYCVAELCQLIIKEISSGRNWPMQTWPGKIQLPTELFAPMANTREAQEIVTKVYIPEDIQGKLRPIIKLQIGGSTKRKIPQEKSKSTKKPSKKPKGSQPKSQKPTKQLDIQPFRKSNRAKATVNYIQESDDDSVYD